MVKIVSIKGNMADVLFEPLTAGYTAEKHLEQQGWSINSGVGPDITVANIEVKTRKSKSTSAHTIGSMSIDKIFNSSYYSSNICKKFQKQYRIKYDGVTHHHINDKLFDFSSKEIQAEMEKSWKLNSEKIKEYVNCPTTYLPPMIKHPDAKWYWEKKSSRSYAARIPHAQMKKFEEMASVAKANSSLFE